MAANVTSIQHKQYVSSAKINIKCHVLCMTELIKLLYICPVYTLIKSQFNKWNVRRSTTYCFKMKMKPFKHKLMVIRIGLLVASF